MASNDWTFVYSEVHSLPMNEAFFEGFTRHRHVPGMLDVVLYVNRGGLQTCYTPKSELERVKQEGKLFFERAWTRTKGLPHAQSDNSPLPSF